MQFYKDAIHWCETNNCVQWSQYPLAWISSTTPSPSQCTSLELRSWTFFTPLQSCAQSYFLPVHKLASYIELLLPFPSRYVRLDFGDACKVPWGTEMTDSAMWDLGVFFLKLSHSCLTASYFFPSNYWVDNFFSSAKKHLVSTVHISGFGLFPPYQGPRGVPGIPGPQGPPGQDVSKIKV